MSKLCVFVHYTLLIGPESDVATLCFDIHLVVVVGSFFLFFPFFSLSLNIIWNYLLFDILLWLLLLWLLWLWLLLLLIALGLDLVAFINKKKNTHTHTQSFISRSCFTLHCSISYCHTIVIIKIVMLFNVCARASALDRHQTHTHTHTKSIRSC